MGVFEGFQYRSSWLKDVDKIFEKGGPDGHERCRHFGAKLRPNVLPGALPVAPSRKHLVIVLHTPCDNN